MTEKVDKALRREAKRRVEARSEFYWFLAVCAAVWGALIAIWWVSGQGYFWPVWPILGMGIALFFKAYEAFLPEYASAARIEREYAKLKRRQEA